MWADNIIAAADLPGRFLTPGEGGDKLAERGLRSHGNMQTETYCSCLGSTNIPAST